MLCRDLHTLNEMKQLYCDKDSPIKIRGDDNALYFSICYYPFNLSLNLPKTESRLVLFNEDNFKLEEDEEDGKSVEYLDDDEDIKGQLTVDCDSYLEYINEGDYESKEKAVKRIKPKRKNFLGILQFFKRKGFLIKNTLTIATTFNDSEWIQTHYYIYTQTKEGNLMGILAVGHNNL
jgi:hypothetical protein